MEQNTMMFSVDLICVIAMSLAVVLLIWYQKLPTPQSFHAFLDALNSRGGNILILSLFSVYFFGHSLRLFYALFEASRQGWIKQDNAFALMSLQFVTSSAFGGAMGALLKTMTGESSNRNRSTDPGKPEELVKA